MIQTIEDVIKERDELLELVHSLEFAFLSDTDTIRSAAIQVKAFVEEGKRCGSLKGVGLAIEILVNSWLAEHHILEVAPSEIAEVREESIEDYVLDLAELISRMKCKTEDIDHAWAKHQLQQVVIECVASLSKLKMALMNRDGVASFKAPEGKQRDPGPV